MRIDPRSRPFCTTPSVTRVVSGTGPVSAGVGGVGGAGVGVTRGGRGAGPLRKSCASAAVADPGATTLLTFVFPPAALYLLIA